MKVRYGKLSIIKTIIIILAFVCISLVVLCIVRNNMFSPEKHDKIRFTSEEVSFISGYLGVDLNKSNIDEATFSHAKDSVFIFYISNIEIDNINSKFEKLYESKDEISFQSPNNSNIKCIFNKNSNTATIRVEEYNSELYKIIKKD